MTHAGAEPSAIDLVRTSGRWAQALDLLNELDPAWSEQFARMTINPWTDGVMSAKENQLIAVGLSASITNMDGSALRKHIRAALQAGATKTEILEVLKMAALLALHPMSLGAPILIEEAKAAGKTAASGDAKPATPFCDKMKSIGQWNVAWDPFFEIDPLWTEQFISAGTGFYTNGVLTPKFVELISIAFDASITHMYAPGTRRHIKAALALGAGVVEVMHVLKLCVAMGANALDLGIPILHEELEAFVPPVPADGFVEAMDLANLGVGTSETVKIEGKTIALFNVGGQIYATGDACPHAGASLGWGILEGKVVKCRSHGLRFDVTTGTDVGCSGLSIHSYPTRIEGGKILVKVG